MLSSLLLHISPQVGFASEAPGSCEVIDLLLRIHSSQFARSNEWRPQNVPTRGTSASVYKMKPCRLQCIDDTVVRVRLTADPEREVRIRLELVLRYHLNPIRFEWPLHLQERWVVEKDRWRPSRNRPVVQHYPVIWRSFQVDFLLCHVAGDFGCLYLQNKVL